MTTPGSSGKVGPTPIPVDTTGAHDGEQVRPSFTFGQWFLSLGDVVTGIHRFRKEFVEGTVIVLAGTVCVSTSLGVYPIQRIAIHSVQPPLFDVDDCA